jgi:hypothetical protein
MESLEAAAIPQQKNSLFSATPALMLMIFLLTSTEYLVMTITHTEFLPTAQPFGADVICRGKYRLPWNSCIAQEIDCLGILALLGLFQ